MNKFEKTFLSCILGTIMPLIGFLGGWWSFCKISSNGVIILAAIFGLAAGVLVNAFFLKKWVEKAYQLNIVIWMVIYIFYSICVFGFFMGVPVFNLSLAAPTGIFIGSKLSHVSMDAAQQQQTIFRTKLFTACILTMICLASAFLALKDPYTAANLEGMLHLDFNVTRTTIIGIIIVGGAVILSLQWWLTAKFIQVGRKLAYRPA